MGLAGANLIDQAMLQRILNPQDTETPNLTGFTQKPDGSFSLNLENPVAAAADLQPVQPAQPQAIAPRQPTPTQTAATARQTPTPTVNPFQQPAQPGNVGPFDPQSLSLILGQLGQAFGAGDPTSPQFQVGQLFANRAQNQIFGQLLNDLVQQQVAGANRPFQ